MSAIAASDHPFPEQVARRRRAVALADEITELCGYINAATYHLLEMIREFDQDELWQADGICSCAHWLNWKCGIGLNAAREKVRVARALGNLSKISASFSRGEISYSKARAMTRVATPENEDYLLMIATHGTAYHVEELVRKYRRAVKSQETDEANRQHEERTLQVYYEADGSITINARLPAEKAALVLKAIESAMEEDDVSAETSAKEPWDRRKADALVDIAESYLANGPAASSSADRHQVMLHVSAETLTNADGDVSHIEDGPRVSAETSRRICCDAGINVMSVTEEGTPLNIGRKTRVIPPAMRRALRARDEGCRFPGCTRKHYVDGHHVKHWCEGGETSLDNLVQLCRYHHRLVHEGGFSCRKNAKDRVEFRTTEGALINETGYMPPLPTTLDITERLRHRYEDLDIDANTCVSKFDDVRIDWELAVGAMFSQPRSEFGVEIEPPSRR